MKTDIASRSRSLRTLLFCGAATALWAIPGTIVTSEPHSGGTDIVAIAVSPSQAINLSTRIRVLTDDNVGIAGFLITGSAPKHVVIRGIGPSLQQNGAPVPGRMADPVLELYGPCDSILRTNDNWRDVQEAELQATGLAPTDDREAAIDATLAPGAYTAIVTGKNRETGMGLIEVYDIDQGVDSKLANISTRAFVHTGDNVVIAGFVLGNNSGDDMVVVRGLGPSLTGAVANALQDPTLELRDDNGTLLVSNNDWQDNPAQAAQIIAAGLAPSDTMESAIVATLAPGFYTAILAGVNNTTGVGLVEIYDRGDGSGVPPPPPPPPCPPTPTPTPTPTPSPATPCTENFDGVSAPALPPGWAATNAAGPGPPWATSPTTPDTAPNDAVVKAPPEISDKRLDTPSIAVTSAAAQLSFRNSFSLEFSNGLYRDGGVLEVSSPNLNGGAFTDITDPAVGGAFVIGGYTGTIDGTRHNPIAGRMAWSGNSGGYIDTVVNLGPNVNGQTIRLRFRLGTDEAVAAGGWRVDTISITGGSCP